VAFFVYALMPDRWDGASGTYLGKDWASLNTLYNIYEIEDRKIVTTFISEIQSIYMELTNAEIEKKRKAAERKASASSGKKYAHNVRANG
tara:strand:+ start:183 stop:452 length:270 start_codon:yes stop_codon:yes gene_type:complete